MPATWYRRRSTACVAFLPLLVGCPPQRTVLRIVDLADPGSPARLFEEFTDCCFSADPDGNVQVLLRRASPSERDPRQLIHQLVVIDTAYRPVPGTSAVEATMINATLRYVIATGSDALLYRGAGFVSFTRSRDGRTLFGKVESGQLSPARTTGSPVHPFREAMVSGEFRATHDPRRLARLLRETPLLGPASPPGR